MGVPNKNIFVKDAFHNAIIKGEHLPELSKQKTGTKFSPVYKMKIAGGATKTIFCRLMDDHIIRPAH